MSQKPLITIIVPVYAAEQYMHQCIDSILAQTYTNLEVLLVDDGSPGDAPRICDEYAAADSRVKVIHKPNGGLADARNAGLNVATGEYISHVDHDDWIAPDMIEFLYNSIVTNDVDISLCCEYLSYVNINIPRRHFNELIIMTNTEAAEMTLTKKEIPSTWAKLYKKEIFENIRYPVGKIPEDAWVIIDVIMAAKRLAFHPEHKYYYRQRKSSILHKPSAISKIVPKLELFESRHNSISTKYPELAEMSQALLYRRYIIALNNIFSDKDYRNTPDGKALFLSIIVNIEKIAGNLFDNSYLTNEDKFIIRILVTHLYMIPLMFMKYKKKMSKKFNKKKDRNYPQERILFE